MLTPNNWPPNNYTTGKSALIFDISSADVAENTLTFFLYFSEMTAYAFYCSKSVSIPSKSLAKQKLFVGTSNFFFPVTELKTATF